MSLTATSGIPRSITAGNTLRLTVSNSSYPASLFTLALILSLDGTVLGNIAGTAIGNDFTIEATHRITGAWTPGRYNYVCYYTEISSGERAQGESGMMIVMPNFAVSQPETINQANLRLARATYQLVLEAGPDSSVQFNGQSYTRQNMLELSRLINELERKVQAEQRALGYETRGPRNVQVSFRN